MARVRLFIFALTLAGLVLLPTACGGRNSQDSAADTPAPAVEEAEAGVEAAATEAEGAVDAVAESAEEAEATAEETAGEVATAVPEAETVVEEAQGQAEAEVAPLIQVASETFIGDVIGKNDPTHVTLSTSGAQLVWPQAEGRFWNREGELCTYTFESAATECAVAPDTFFGYPYAFSWSPDDAYITFTENPIQQGYESDIWIFDPVNQEYTDLTDDGVEGDWVSSDPGSYTLDYLPMWGQENEIYFWRSIPNPDFPLSVTLSIMRVNPEVGDAELVRDLQGIRGGKLIWFDDEAWFMDGVSVLSPDGRQVAVLAVSESADAGMDASDGLWLIDLEDESIPPRQLVTAEDFQMANPSWAATPLRPSGLSWQADGERLVVLAQNNDPQVPLVVLYDVDVADGALTPVVDFSTVPDIEDYTAQPGGVGVPPRGYSPWTASLSPENDKLLMYQNIAGVAGLMVSPLPPTGDLPGLDYESQLQESVATPRSSRSKDGKVLMYNILFNLVLQ